MNFYLLELRQYKNGLDFVKKSCFEIATLFPHRHGKGKRVAISKLACVSQKRIRSYIVLALEMVYMALAKIDGTKSS